MDFRAEFGKIDRKIVAVHLPFEQAMHAIVVLADVVHIERVLLRVCGQKEWKPLDVIPVRMAEEHVDFELVGAASTEIQAELTETGASVANEQTVVEAELHARGVASVRARLVTRSRNRAARSPKPHEACHQVPSRKTNTTSPI